MHWCRNVWQRSAQIFLKFVYVHKYIYIYVCVCVNSHIYMRVCVCVYMRVSIYIYIHIYIHTHIYICERICVCVCIYIYMCVCIYLYIRIYTTTQTRGKFFCDVTPRTYQDVCECFSGISFTTFQMKVWMKETGYWKLQSVTTGKTNWIFLLLFLIFWECHN